MRTHFVRESSVCVSKRRHDCRLSRIVAAQHMLLMTTARVSFPDPEAAIRTIINSTFAICCTTAIRLGIFMRRIRTESA